MATAGILWRRLDVPGHDACRVRASAPGWTIEGTALFREAGLDARLDYLLACDEGWRTRHGRVSGWLGERAVAIDIERSQAGDWLMNGAAVSGLAGCVDLDLGFTPATNVSQLRRLALAPGQAADVPVAWLDVAAGTLERLDQRYERRSPTTYWYEARRFDYAATLHAGDDGFIHDYPGLWQAEPIARNAGRSDGPAGLTSKSRANAEHYRWGGVCDGWRLLDRADLSVIQERIPPGAGEVSHHHARARQLFYVLEGALVIEVGAEVFRLERGDSLEVAPGEVHRVRNDAAADATFLVVSAPSTRGDRTDETP